MDNLQIRIFNETPGKTKIPRKLVTTLLANAYNKRRRKRAAVNLLVAGDEEITRLNVRYLRHDFTTDVISFPDGETVLRGAVQLGDIAVNAELAGRLAAENGWKPEQELALYALHGLLHLLGYDDHSEADYQAMVAAQRAEFARIGLECRI
ncbi:MAG: rRNA maturation RNase YbeY [Planctomycetes bacterium]|nr:rRNA maturation RNase YbeY [Planctomycetota bacterium]